MALDSQGNGCYNSQKRERGSERGSEGEGDTRTGRGWGGRRGGGGTERAGRSGFGAVTDSSEPGRGPRSGFRRWFPAVRLDLAGPGSVRVRLEERHCGRREAGGAEGLEARATFRGTSPACLCSPLCAQKPRSPERETAKPGRGSDDGPNTARRARLRGQTPL